jgi:hypothetical protein
MRLAYTELNWGNHKLQLGQQNDLIFAMAPTSLSHIAFPLGYFTGNLGWRRPGIFGFHTLPLSKDMKLEGAWEVGRSQWADSAACVVTPVPGGTTSCSGVGGAAAGTGGGVTWGEASAAPAVEGRVSLMYSKLLTAFVGAHWNQVDLSGYGSGLAPFPADTSVKNLKVVTYNAGAKLTAPLANDMSVTVAATGFTGANVYPLIANFTTGVQPTATNNFGTFRIGLNGEDINTMGYWAQAGFNVTKELSIWGLYGQQKIDEKDLARSFGTGAVASTAFENATTNVFLMYRDGGYGLSLEWINFQTKYGSATNQATGVPGDKFTTTRTAKSDQYLLSANYFF